MADMEVKTAGSKLNGFMEKNRKAFIGIFATLIALLIAFIVVTAIMNNGKNKAIAAIDEITFELTNGSTGLEDAEIKSRCEAALEKILPYTKKGGIAGARANMVAAEIQYNLKDYNASADYWKAVASKAKKTYLEPIAQYNIGSCNEQLNNLDAAAEAYKAASEIESFVLRPHAMFSYGRVLETQNKSSEAYAVYSKLNDILPNDAWSHLAKSRMIALENAGKAN